MALFSDGPLSTIDELRDQDSQLADMASAEGIDVTKKLALAHVALAIELEALLARAQASTSTSWTLANVAGTPPLKLWYEYWALETVYADGFFSHLNDRYEKKRDQFDELGQWANEKLVEAGIGIVEDPIPRAETPIIANALGTPKTGTFYVTMTWLSGTGEEGSPAPTGSIVVAEPVDETESGSFSVTARTAPTNATGWNVFVGVDPEQLVIQNAAPLAPDEVWFPPDELSTEGRGPGNGQSPNSYLPVPQGF